MTRNLSNNARGSFDLFYYQSEVGLYLLIYLQLSSSLTRNALLYQNLTFYVIICIFTYLILKFLFHLESEKCTNFGHQEKN